MRDNSVSKPRSNGFDILRIMLAAGIVAFHSFTITTGHPETLPAPIRAVGSLILPAFFALSGYLVMGSLMQCRSSVEFIALRLLRIMPGLIIVVSGTALLMGPALSNLSVTDYFQAPEFATYFQNIVMQPQFALPGVFEDLPRAGIVNGSLWTISVEMICYALLAALAIAFRGGSLTIALCCLAALLVFPKLPYLGLLLAWLAAKPLPLAFCAGAILYKCAELLPLNGYLGLASVGFAILLALPHPSWAVASLSYAVVWFGTRDFTLVRLPGDYSYGTYLVAYPIQQAVLYFFSTGLNWWTNLLIALPLALLLGAALWHWIERPILSRKYSILNALKACRVGRGLQLLPLRAQRG